MSKSTDSNMHDPRQNFASNNVVAELSVSTYISRWTENHNKRVAIKKKLDAKILGSFLLYKAKIYRFHRKLWLSRTL